MSSFERVLFTENNTPKFVNGLDILNADQPRY